MITATIKPVFSDLNYHNLRIQGIKQEFNFFCQRLSNRSYCLSSSSKSASDAAEHGKNETSSIDKSTDALNPGSNPTASSVTPKDLQSENVKDSKDGSPDKKKKKVLKITPRMRKPNPVDYSYTGNVYILPQRALVEYVLKSEDLSELPKYTRRSPYADGTRIVLHLRTDVEKVALKKIV